MIRLAAKDAGPARIVRDTVRDDSGMIVRIRLECGHEIHAISADDNIVNVTARQCWKCTSDEQ